MKGHTNRAHAESVVTPFPGERRSFGGRLKRARERRGISLESIAEHTKVSAGLLAGLEANDLSKWPGGIYRTSFVRGYAEAIGLDAVEVVAEFARHYPGDNRTAPLISAALAPDGEVLRLTIDEPSTGSFLSALTARVPALAGALVDSLVATGAAFMVSAILGDRAFWIALCAGLMLTHVLGIVWPAVVPRRFAARLAARWCAIPSPDRAVSRVVRFTERPRRGGR